MRAGDPADLRVQPREAVRAGVPDRAVDDRADYSGLRGVGELHAHRRGGAREPDRGLQGHAQHDFVLLFADRGKLVLPPLPDLHVSVLAIISDPLL